MRFDHVKARSRVLAAAGAAALVVVPLTGAAGIAVVQENAPIVDALSLHGFVDDGKVTSDVTETIVADPEATTSASEPSIEVSFDSIAGASTSTTNGAMRVAVTEGGYSSTYDVDVAALIAQRQAAWEADGSPEVNQDPLPIDYFGFPVSSVHITSQFGTRYHPVTGALDFHVGTDFNASCGTPIYAAAGGTVTWAKYRAYKGNQVLIEHGYFGGKYYMTDYGHMSSFAVSPGQTVEKGQLVGYSGATGNVTGCHLHFEVWEDDFRVDPMPFLD